MYGGVLWGGGGGLKFYKAINRDNLIKIKTKNKKPIIKRVLKYMYVKGI